MIMKECDKCHKLVRGDNTFLTGHWIRTKNPVWDKKGESGSYEHKQEICKECWEKSNEKKEEDAEQKLWNELPKKQGDYRWWLRPKQNELSTLKNVVISEISDYSSKEKYKIRVRCPDCDISPTKLIHNSLWFNLRYCDDMPIPYIGQVIKQIDYETYIYSKWSEGYNIIYITYE